MRVWWFGLAGLVGAVAAVALVMNPTVSDSDISYEVTDFSPKITSNKMAPSSPEVTAAPPIDMSINSIPPSSEPPPIEAQTAPRPVHSSPSAQRAFKRRDTPAGRAAATLAVQWQRVKRALDGENLEIIQEIDALDIALTDYHRSPSAYSWDELEMQQERLLEQVKTDYSDQPEMLDVFSIIDAQMELYRGEVRQETSPK